MEYKIYKPKKKKTWAFNTKLNEHGDFVVGIVDENTGDWLTTLLIISSRSGKMYRCKNIEIPIEYEVSFKLNRDGQIAEMSEHES